LEEKELSKEDWKKIITVGTEKNEIRKEMSTLKSTVDRLAKDAGRMKDTLYELAQKFGLHNSTARIVAISASTDLWIGS